MKKAIRIVCILLLFTLLFGCTGPSKYSYEIRNVDGVNYIFIKEVVGKTPINGSDPYFTLHFDSYQDFIDTIQNGKFTDEEWEILKISCMPSGKCKIPDFAQLPEYFGPEGSQFRYMTWTPGASTLSYYFSMPDDRGRASITICSKENFQILWNEEKFQQEHENTIEKIVTNSERNATIYYYKDYAGARTMSLKAYYTFETENSIYYVVGIKRFDAKIGDAPDTISVYYQISDNQYASTTVSGYGGWPSNEILSSFCLRFPE